MTILSKIALCQTLLWFVLFFLFTACLCVIDVKPTGPLQSNIGFSQLNNTVRLFFGVTPLLYMATDIPLYIAMVECLFFAYLGLYQLIKNKSFKKVSAAIYGLALVYVLMVVWYVGFEKVIINYRPVLLDGALEASYPSSHTMMVVTILWTGILAFKTIFPEHQKLCFWITVLSAALITFTIAGRLVCGVHWFTDIIGALLLSGAMISLYRFLLVLNRKQEVKATL